ncbi:sulfate adenylyltransferase subunit CysN [Fulvivirgaceae bacterium PWU4]|uniref:sulfate adenylyltransferase n=1 Tax=Chryseosolibacter histidini TaxID=2782349 RepID=A0AAP2DQ83_9BACT|nr:sulfate adenylyltransferase subunit CysN [Chryseosolibacter histidini]MBT1700545.1 sulfate adenylyltransferase subunit CysN [Chryseosolibacter histidini]
MSTYLDNQLLRFTTAGSVDDGKSTLIGRLLYDSKSIFEDQLEAVEASSAKKGFDYVDLSLLTDGLKSEREQGITIDVAYRYFATPKRKFIIADTPGHIQYTRNMVTGASTANLALILIDARKGLVEQTFRHSYIASLLKIPHIIVCVNKMDLVSYDEAVYDKIVQEYKAFSSKLEVSDIQFVPISALAGDNVVHRSENTPWYQGATLMHMLETVHIESDYNHIDSRFPVQYVIRPQSKEYHDFRGYAGRVAGGIFRPGDDIVVLPSGFNSKIKTIEFGGKPLEEAFAPMSVTMTLADEIDISRGDIIAKPNNHPQSEQDLDLMLCWMNQKPVNLNTKFYVRHTTREVRGVLKEIQYKLDINSLTRLENVDHLAMNDIARVKIRTAQPLFFDSYRKNRITGSLILVDEGTNETVAAGMIV